MPENLKPSKFVKCNDRHGIVVCSRLVGHVGEHFAMTSHDVVVLRWPAVEVVAP